MAGLKKKLSARKEASQGRSKETVNLIIEAATHIIETSETDELNTNNIAKKAGVSIGSLYQYFPSKESILCLIIEKELSRNLNNIREKINAIPADVKIEDFIEELLEIILNLFQKKRKLRLFLFTRLPRGLMPKIHEIEDEFQETIFQKLKGYELKFSDEELRLKTFIIVHSAVGIIHATLGRNRKVEMAAIKKEMHHQIRNTLLA
jgi:AcrR family transcriptional regulator